MKKFYKYLKVWWIYAVNTLQIQLVVRWAVALFLIAKLLRFGIFLFFIIILVSQTRVLAGYSLDQTILFFLSFNLVDILAQMLFREVYRFRQAIVSGTFDFYLMKPINVLFRSLLGGPDIIDFITLIPLIWAIVYFINSLDISSINLFIYIFLIIAGFIISMAFHILVLSLAVVTTEIDSAVLLYRDVSGMGRVPIDIYKEPIRGLLTFVIPVGIMMTFPTKSLLGLLSPLSILYAFLFSIVFLFTSLKVWHQAVLKYSSASS
ncbi:ABC-2 family transporter protein [Candidatus Daviesbacteria bacterium]|nr:ABC-2 family transporter protein [Candidatus Daviesbacteria bacterium]